MQPPSSGRRLKKPNRTWIRPFTEGGGPLYLQIARQVRSALDDGVLKPGDRLPPQRDLAQHLGVDLTTVTRAIAELRQADLLDAQGAGGTFIALSAGNTATSVDLSMNIPPLLASMPFAQGMERGFQHLARQLGQGELMSYHVGAGSREDRAAAVQWLRPMLGSVAAGRVVICPGAQAALCALILARTQPGDVIAAEQLSYPGLLAAARVLQRGIAPVAMDADGMLPEALDAVCHARRPRLVYLVPTIQNPTTATLPQARREALLAVARRHGVAVIEDDPYWLLAGDAPPPLATASSAQAPVYYLSTLSKCLAPGLRTAYLVVPPGEPMEPLLDALRSIVLMPAQSMLAVASHWIRSGQADEMVRRFQHELGQRQQIAARILPAPYQAHPTGLHVWLPLPARLDQYRLIQSAQAQGLGVASSEAFSVEDQPENAIRLSLGGAVDQSSLAAALSRLTATMAGTPQSRAPTIV